MSFIFKRMSILMQMVLNFRYNFYSENLTAFMSLSFQITNHRILCQLLPEGLRIRLQPIDLDLQIQKIYIYQALYNHLSIPPQIQFLFDENIEVWFKYIDFYRERCFQLDLQTIKLHAQQSHQSPLENGQLPIYFSMHVLPTEKPRRLRLSGTRQLYSRQKILQKLVQELNSKLNFKEKIISEMQEKLKNAAKDRTKLLGRIEELEGQNIRLSNQEPLRKRIHTCESQQDVQEEESYEKSSSPIQHSENHLEQLSGQVQARFGLAQNIVEESHQQANQLQPDCLQIKAVNQQRANENDHIKQNTIQDISSLNFSNQHNSAYESGLIQNKDSCVSFGLENHTRRQTQSSPEGMKSIGIEQVPQKTTFQTQILNNHQNSELRCSAVSLNIPNSFMNSKIESDRNSLDQDKHEMIRGFASKKCHLEVGFDDKGSKKFGFCCIFCEKVFKEDEFLYKHFVMKHPQMLYASQDYLDGQLIKYKKKRQQRIMMIEANQAAEKRNKLDNAIIKLTTR